MKLKAYAVRDLKAGAYSVPFFSLNDNTALRTATDWANDTNHPFGKHPEDYELFSLGTYDDETALLTPDELVFTAHLNALRKAIA